jgi:hypothetical protein
MLIFPFGITILGSIFPNAEGLFGQILNVLNGFVGYYYLQSISFAFLILWFYLNYRAKPLRIPFSVAILSLIAIVVFLNTQNVFQVMLFKSKDPVGFIESILKSRDWLLRVGFLLHINISSNGRVHGMLGIFYGLISVYTVYMATRCKTNRYLRKISKHAISYISIVSLAMIIMIFAVKAIEYLYSIRHVMSIMSLFLGSLFLSLGFTLQTGKGCVDARGLVSFLLHCIIAFVLGFIFGNLSIPFTRSPFITLEGKNIIFNGQQIYFTPIGSFFFMYLSTLTIAVAVYLILDEDCPLSSIAIQIYSKYLK